MPRQRDVWTDEKRKLFEEAYELYGRSSKDIAAHIGDGMTAAQVSNYKAIYKKQQEEAAAAAAEATASAVQPATPLRPRATDAPPAAPVSEETLRPPPPAPRNLVEGVEESKSEATPTKQKKPAVVTPSPQDTSSVATSNDAAPPNQQGNSAKFVLAVINTKGGGRKDKETKRSLPARSKEENEGVTQKESGFFQKLMALFLSYVNRRFCSVPAAWLVTEAPWVLNSDNMSALSQQAPYGASSRLETKNRPDAAVIWGAKFAEGAEALTLSEVLSDRDTGEHYVEVQKAGESILRVNLEHLHDTDKKEYERMLKRVAAARLTLSVGQCLFLSYHGPSTGFDDEEKGHFFRWLLQLARSLADLLGIPVVLGGDLNLDVSKLEVQETLGDAAKGAELVKYKVNPRREGKVLDWLYLINPRDGFTCLVCERCEAIDPAQPYREELAAEEGVRLHPKWFDHDALLAVLRLKFSWKFKFWSSFNYQHQYHHWVPSSLCSTCRLDGPPGRRLELPAPEPAVAPARRRRRLRLGPARAAGRHRNTRTDASRSR